MKNKLSFIKEATTEELLNGSSSFGNNIDVVLEVYKWLFTKGCSTCPSKFLGYIETIKNYAMDTKCSYKLKSNGQVTVSALGGKVMSNHNITDNKAEAFLSTNPISRKSMFEILPEDWEARVKEYGKPVEVKEEVELKAEVESTKPMDKNRKKTTKKTTKK